MKILNHYIIELAKTLSGHWYKVWVGTPEGEKGEYLGAFPSSTTILNAYPQSLYLTQWIAEKGWSESQHIKSEAGERGTNIHTATELLENGIELKEENYSLEEWWKISSFVDWHNAIKPVLIAKEFPVFSQSGGYAGRLDRIYNIGGEITLLDIKSSSGIHEHFPLQFASYAKAIEENTDLEIVQTACLQLGAQNKNNYRFVVYPDWRDHYKVFEHVQATWYYNYFSSKKNPKEPPILELPKILKLEMVK